MHISTRTNHCVQATADYAFLFVDAQVAGARDRSTGNLELPLRADGFREFKQCRSPYVTDRFIG